MSFIKIIFLSDFVFLSSQRYVSVLVNMVGKLSNRLFAVTRGGKMHERSHAASQNPIFGVITKMMKSTRGLGHFSAIQTLQKIIHKRGGVITLPIRMGYLSKFLGSGGSHTRPNT